MKISSIVTTCPRKTLYLSRTIESLEAASFSPEVSVDDEKSGSWANFRKSLKIMLPMEWDALCIFQDDIIVSRGLMELLQVSLWPSPERAIGCVSLYTAGATDTSRDGWNQIVESKQFYGALAYVLPRQIAIELTEVKPESPTGTDSIVGQFCVENGLEYWTHFPSLVQHIGEVSSIDETYGIGDEGSQQRLFRSASHFCSDAGDLIESHRKHLGNKSPLAFRNP